MTVSENLELASRRREEEQFAIYGVNPDAGQLGESLIDTFYRLTTQKTVLARREANMILQRQENLSAENSLVVVDFGTSKGTLINKLAGQLLSGQLNHDIDFTFVEPDERSAELLRRGLSTFEDMGGGRFKTQVVQKTWQKAIADWKLEKRRWIDFAFANHVIYHIDPAEYQQLFVDTIDQLLPHGKLVLSARQHDVIFELNQNFYERVTGNEFNTITAIDMTPAIREIARNDRTLILKMEDTRAEIKLPFGTSPDDAIRVLAFGFGVSVDLLKKDENLIPDIKTFLNSLPANKVRLDTNADMTLSQTDLLITVERNGENLNSNGS